MKRARLSVDIPVELKDRLRLLIPWGLISHTFEVITEDMCDTLEKAGPRRAEVLSLILNRMMKLSDYTAFGGKNE